MIKRLLFVATFCSMGMFSFGQNLDATPVKVDRDFTVSPDRVVDTIFDYLMRASNLYSYGAPNGGNAIGTGYYDAGSGPVLVTEGYGMHYDGIQNATITEIIFIAAEYEIVGNADNVTVGWYDVNSDSTPNTLQASATIVTSDFDTSSTGDGLSSSGALTPTATSGNPFAVVMEWGVIDDTLGIIGSADGDAAGEERVLSKLSATFGGGWIHGSVYTGFDLDIMMFPVVDVVAGVEEGAVQNGLHLHGAYPNPATYNTTIKYSLDNADEVSIKIFDLTGKTVYSEQGNRTAGEYIIDVNTSELSNGNYYYTITTSEAQMTSKFIVNK